jgi:hypothetical protein
MRLTKGVVYGSPGVSKQGMMKCTGHRVAQASLCP